MARAQMNWSRVVLLAAVAALASLSRAADVGAAAAATPATATTGDIPKTMRAAAFDRPGGPEVLSVHTLPVPELDANEVLIAVSTAGVSVWDGDNRQRLAYISKPHFPVVIGSDGAGLVAAVGSGVTSLRVGDRVYGSCWDNPKGGFYAEYAAVPARCMTHLPKGVSLDAAGALAASGLTALRGIDEVLRVKPGERLIIHGASGAVGTLAVQFAKLRGAMVLATASGDDGIALVRRLGADAAVEGHHGDIAAAAHNFAPQGADAVLALAAGDGLQRCIDALRPGGHVAYPGGVEPAPKAHEGITVVAYDAVVGSEEAALVRLNQVIESRKFEIPIAATFALAEADKAHERLAVGHVLGKVLLRVR